MGTGTRLLVSGAPATRLGQVVFAGEVIDDEPVMSAPAPLRVMRDYVLSVVFDGTGTYWHANRTRQPITPGAVTVVHPNQPHWYGTAPGERWTELFVVFRGPLFDTFAAAGLLANKGPRYPRPAPSMAVLRTVLHTTPLTRAAAEHQLLALADWLVDTATSEAASGPSPAIARAVELLTRDLAAPVDLHTVADEIGLPYDTFRRRFRAEIGQAPLAFRNARRLQAASTLLRLTDMTVRAIARTLGYTDEFHLSRRFRAHYGLSPRNYRQSGLSIRD